MNKYDTIKFDMPEAEPSIIMVAGVGGGGSNAVNHMFHLGITDVSFVVCNTDVQSLNRSQIPIKVVLGQSLTQGLGAGNKPEVGQAAAEESFQEIVDIFKLYNTKMVFVTAGMGGGTGTGAAPVIARAAKELGILTIAIVTIPFKTEGPTRYKQAMKGIEEMRKYVDSLLVINNENILELHGELGLSEAFGMADDILASAAKGIAEIITGNNYINVDFRDIQTVMSNSGVALMGSGRAGGENRSDEAVKAALASPLLNHRDISGARNILLNITSGTRQVTLSETYHITNFVQEQTGNVADLIWGAGNDESLGEDIKVTIIATGFDTATIENILDTKTQGESILNKKDEAEPVCEVMVEEEKAEQIVENPVVEIEAKIDIEDQPKVAFTPKNPFQIHRKEDGRSVIAIANEKSAFDKIEKQSVEEINYDELERSPAWLRRKMSFAEASSEEKISRVTLKDDSQPRKEDSNNALF